MGACGQVDRTLDSRSEGLGFDSQCWSCVEVSGKLHPAAMSSWCTIATGCCAPIARGGKV